MDEEEIEKLKEDIPEMNEKQVLNSDMIVAINDIQDEIEKEIIIQELEEKAKELKILSRFKRILAAVKAEKKRLEKALTQQNTDSEVPLANNEVDFKDVEEKMYCGQWQATDAGIVKISDRGKLVACPHPIYISKRFSNIQTGKEKVRLRFKKTEKAGWKEMTVERGVVSSNSRIVALADYGVAVTSESARNLVNYLSDLENYSMDAIPEQKSTSKLGWINGTFIPYDAEVTFDNDDKFRSLFDSIKESGSKDVWFNLVKDIRKKNRIEANIYLVASFASILIEPLHALPFVVDLWGETGKGKTVALMLAASVWANPGADGYIPKAKSTETSLEVRLDFLNNLPLMFDDLSQLKRQYKDDFSNFVYMLCSGRSKERSNKELGLSRALTWSNVIITNSEHSLVTESMQGGAVNRILDVEMGEGYIFENGNEVVETITNNYGFAGKMFVEIVNKVGIDSISKLQKDFFQKIKDRADKLENAKEEKQMIPLSILLATDKILTEELFHDGIYLDFDKCFDIIKDHSEVSENERAYDYFMSQLLINVKYFIKEGKTSEDSQAATNNQIWGVITPDWNIIDCQIFRQWCEESGCEYNSFLSWAKARGYILCENGRKTKNKRICGKARRCIWLKDKAEEEPEDDKNGFISVDESDEELPF